MGTCFLHDPPEKIADVELLDHLRVVHPETWGGGPERWPDGRIVVHNTAMTPGDFTGWLCCSDPTCRCDPGECACV